MQAAAVAQRYQRSAILSYAAAGRPPTTLQHCYIEVEGALGYLLDGRLHGFAVMLGYALHSAEHILAKAKAYRGTQSGSCLR